jgi:hypothetical protein
LLLQSARRERLDPEKRRERIASLGVADATSNDAMWGAFVAISAHLSRCRLIGSANQLIGLANELVGSADELMGRADELIGPADELTSLPMSSLGQPMSPSPQPMS